MLRLDSEINKISLGAIEINKAYLGNTIVYDNTGVNTFVSTWDTTKSGVSSSNQIALPLIDTGTYSFDVVYGGVVIKTITSYTDNVVTFPDGSGVKEIECIGTLTGFRFNNSGDKLKILSISSFGTSFRFFNGQYSFYGCANITSIQGNLDTTGISSLFSFARGCTSLVTLDVSNWDISGVSNLSEFVRDCPSLTNLDVSNWDVSLVISMTFFAYNCTSLTSLDVSNWDVGGVVNASVFIRNCTSLTSLDVSNWNVSAVTNFNAFARGCTSLVDLDISNWNVSSVTNMTNFCANSTIQTNDYSAALIYWDSLTLQSGVTANFGSTKYSAGAATAARLSIITSDGWSITDGGQE